MKSLTIIGMSILACVIYGIAHDQITARLCLEYFTIFHAPVFGTDNPTLLGIGWGILATWWVGLFLGVPLAVVSRAGRLPKRSVADLIRPIAILTDLWAHNASYGAGFVGGLVMMALIWRGRRVAGSGPSPTQQRQQQAEQDTSDDQPQ